MKVVPFAGEHLDSILHLTLAADRARAALLAVGDSEPFSTHVRDRRLSGFRLYPRQA